MELIHNNYMRGTGNGPTWNVEIDPPTRPVKSYYEEACVAAEMVWSQKQGTVYVMYSGGMDSEYVINVFLSLGMDVTPVIMRLQPNYNDHDFQYALKFCNKRGLSYQIIDLDFDKFVSSGKMFEIATRNKAGRYELTASMWLASQLDGTVLTGNDPPLLLHRYKSMPGVYLEELEYIHSQFNCWRNDGIYGTPFFLSYTPEMMLAILNEQTFVDFSKTPQIKNTDSVKIGVFNNQNKFVMETRTKFTGYEYVAKSKIYNHPDIQRSLKEHKQWCGVTYFEYNKLRSWLTSQIPEV